MKQNMFLIKEKPHNVVEKPTHRAGNKMWENWMEKEMEIFPNFILEKKQKSTIFEFIINPKNGQPILEHDKIQVISSYRNYTYQNGIWERKYKANQAKKIAAKENIEKIIEYSTIPGTSRHHWGTDLDIIDGTRGIPADPLNEKHFNEGGSMHKFKLWLDENASKYGFYLVYTDNPTSKGFKYEPWHFTYKAISEPMLQAYKKLDIKKVLQENKLLGSENFTDDFIEKYRKENILDINPVIK